VESRHLTFDESSFPAANCLSNHVSDEDPDDSDYASISGESSACESDVASECDDQFCIYCSAARTNVVFTNSYVDNNSS
jgi:hypothetical protein